MSEDAQEVVNVRVKWPLGVGNDSRPVNQFVLQPGPPLARGGHDSLMYLVLGHIAPPVLLNDEDFQELRDVGESRVQVQAEVVMTRQRLEDLRDLITRQLEVTEGLQR